MPPNFSKDPKVSPKEKTTEEEKEESWVTFPNSQDFKGRRACWSSRRGLRQTHKRKFKMKSTFTTKKKGWLVQVEWKWCDEFNKNNLKHKLYMACNLWEEAPLSSL
jgi:hypothetical protein